MIQYIVTDALFFNLFVGAAAAFLITFVGIELVKYIKSDRKYTNYLNAFKTAMLMKIADDKKIPVEEYLFYEKEMRGIDRVVKDKIIEYIEEQEKSKPKEKQTE